VKVVFTTTQGYAYAEYGRLVPLLTKEFTGKQLLCIKNMTSWLIDPGCNVICPSEQKLHHLARNFFPYNRGYEKVIQADFQTRCHDIEFQ
jgi:hypothetical protein